LKRRNIYSSIQLELKYKQQINNFLLKEKNPQSEMSFSLSSSNTSSTSMKSHSKVEISPLDQSNYLPNQIQKPVIKGLLENGVPNPIQNIMASSWLKT